MFFIEMQGGGKKPPQFRGEYTSHSAAQEEVDAYLVKADYGIKRKKQRQAEEANATSEAGTN